MPVLQVAYKEAAPKVALVQNDGTALPAGYLDAGSFDHPDPVYPGSLVLFHGVRDCLYHFKQLNMGEVSIQLADGVIASYVTSIDVPFGTRALRLDDLPEYGQDKLNARAWPPGAADTSLTYASSDATIVSVSEDGTLTAHKKGEAVITITAPGSAGATKLTRKVTVSVGGEQENPAPPVAVASVTVAPTTASVVVGATRQLAPTVLPADAGNKNVTYTSSAPSIATVSGSGLVTGVSAGTANITVKTVDGNKTAVAAITVTAP